MVTSSTTPDAVPPSPKLRVPSPVKRNGSSASNAWRRATADLRARPHFVVLGTMRGGTTSLYRWLGSHPRIVAASRKEIHYFDVHYEKGPRWYRSQFPILRPGQVTGEASPYMLFHPLAPARAARDLPASTRFIVLLREPVARTVSHYWFTRRRKRLETESLERALELEPERLAKETERVLRGENSDHHASYSYVARSEYAWQMRAWFDAVGRERILVVESEKLWTDPAAAAGIVEWLGLTPHDHEFPVFNQSERLDVDRPETLAELHEHFVPYNRELFDLLGYELWTDIPSG